ILGIGMVSLICKRITDQELYELAAVLKRQKDKNDSSESSYFHLALAATSNHRTLENFIQLTRQLLNEVRNQAFPNRQNQIDAFEEHNELLKAIKERNVQKSKSAIKRHFKNIRSRLE